MENTFKIKFRDKKNMKIKKAFLFFALGLILSSCAQSTAMLGPAITLVSTGNVSQAGITFVTNKAVQEETGMDTVSYVSKKIEQNNSKTKLRREFKNLVKNNFEKTREILILQDQSNTFR
tara:strand:- start:44 stop:403 length:360 start_codon:yes stop_codon:yes gene_type:complete